MGRKCRKKCMQMVAENRKLRAELKQAKIEKQNYWNHIVWLQTVDECKPHPGPCPECGSKNAFLEGSICCSKFFVWCQKCDFMGPEGDGERDAIAKWNKLSNGTGGPG